MNNPWNDDRHPLKMLKQLAADENIVIMTFTSYEIVKEGYGPEYRQRNIAEIPVGDLDKSLDAFITQEVNQGHDVVVDSRVVYKDSAWAGEQRAHLGFVDFDVTSLNTLKSALPSFDKVTPISAYNLRVYSSGRSFHGYVQDHLFSEESWRDFMAALLLVETPLKKPVVDSRWVGHRLLQKSGALRLTKTAERYKAWPQAVDTSDYGDVPF